MTDDTRHGIRDEDLLRLASDMADWTDNKDVDPRDDWSEDRDDLADYLDDFINTVLIYSKELPPLYIVQTAEEFLKRAKLRLDKVDAWDEDKDKLKEALMEMRQYMAKIDESVPPGV